MKRSIFVLLGMGILTVTAPVNAVQKCVALDASSTTCTSSPAAGKADWSATCTTNGTSVPIKGIAMCSNQKADATYGTSDAITTVSSSSDTTNVNCWCKMVEPAVSSWVFIVTRARPPVIARATVRTTVRTAPGSMPRSGPRCFRPSAIDNGVMRRRVWV